MAHDAAFQRGEKVLQRLALLNHFLLICAFLGHIDGHAYRAHDAAVQVVQGRLVGGEELGSIPGLHHFLGDAGDSAVHDLVVGFHAVIGIVGRVVGIHVPYVEMIPSFHLLLCLAHGLAEAFVHFLVEPFPVLVPDQVGDMVDGGLQEMAGLPEILFHLIGGLPSQETEGELLLRQGQGPDIPDMGKRSRKLPNLAAVSQQDELGVLASVCQERPQGLLHIHIRYTGQNHVGFGGQLLLRGGAF